MNSAEETILSGIKFGLKNDVPELTRAIQSANILKAMELNYEFQLGIFSTEEQRVIIKSEKELFLNRNKGLKKTIRNTTRK